MNIVYTDDKKEKYQSVRAMVSFTATPAMGYCTMDAEGFGQSQEEAKKELLAVVKYVIDQISFELVMEEPVRRPGPPHDK